ncbi:MAG: RNA-binding protein [Candidatus Pacearchaeota archaeon]|jgi:RNA recognition motif-containing protein
MKIYVGNLPFSIDEEGLKKIFSKFEIEEATLIRDRYSGRSKGFGFVTIENEEMAKKAIDELNEKEFEGRKLTVNEARPKEDTPRENKPRRSFGSRDNNRRDNRSSGRRY